MGQNYSTATYKKTYGTEYVREYRNYRTHKALYEKGKKEYETISKKLDSKPYQQSEKKLYESKSVDTLNSPQKSQTARSQTINKTSSNTTVQKGYTISEVPPPYSPPGELSQADYSKIDIDALKHPIVSVGGGRYRNIYTEKIVNTAEARRILEYAGYKPKPIANMGLFFLFTLVIAFLIKGVGPIALIIWGFISKNKNMTDYVKITRTNALVFQMPASETERKAYNNRALLYIAAGAIIGFIQVIMFISSHTL